MIQLVAPVLILILISIWMRTRRTVCTKYCMDQGVEKDLVSKDLESQARRYPRPWSNNQ
jgi:hypothetical protein